MNFLGKEIGKKSYPLFIAEISCNHCGSIHNAKSLIHNAKRAGVDFVKIQVYTPDEMTLDCDKANFLITHGLWRGNNLFKFYEKTKTPPEWVPELFMYAKEIDIPIFSSVFGERSLEILEKNNCPAYKIASYEFNHTPLLKAVASTGKPMVLSTGVATDNDIRDNFHLLDKVNKLYMHCISTYPCQLTETNLLRIRVMENIVGKHRVGFSDHSTNSTAAMLAVALGAKIIERHFYSPLFGESEDAEFSMSESAFKRMVDAVKGAYLACNSIVPLEQEGYKFKRSIYASAYIEKGGKFTSDNISVVRPNGGMEPMFYSHLLDGNTANRNIEPGTPIVGDLLE